MKAPQRGQVGRSACPMRSVSACPKTRQIPEGPIPEIHKTTSRFSPRHPCWAFFCFELIGALRLIGKCRSYRFDTRHLQAASALHEVSRPPTEAALACAGIGIVVALRTLPKQAPPTLCYLQPGFAVEIVFCGAGLPLCLFRHASILIVAVHYEPSGSQRFVPRRLWNSKLFDGDLGNLGGVGNAGRTPHVNTADCHGRITICALRDRRSVHGIVVRTTALHSKWVG